jgi:hypothetical protein
MPRPSNSTSVDKTGTKALPTSRITKQNVNKMKPLSKKKEIALTEAEAQELQERVIEILRLEGQTQFIKDTKDEAMRLVNAMTTSNIEEMIPRIPRGEQRTNNFSVFIGRLNPPHKFHLISLITAILIARSNGRPALFLLGDGGGPNIDNPLDFNLKSRFIREKLAQFGFQAEIDYIIGKQSIYFTYIRDFIEKRYNSEAGAVTIFHIGGDKPEKKGSKIMLDVDKLAMPNTFTVAGHEGPIDINCIKVLIQSGGEAMSASRVRKRVCENTKDAKTTNDVNAAFDAWKAEFSPMYDVDSSKDVFSRINSISCGWIPSNGGSRRNHSRKKNTQLRNNKILCNTKKRSHSHSHRHRHRHRRMRTRKHNASQLNHV